MGIALGAVLIVYVTRFIPPVFDGLNMVLAEGSSNTSGRMLVVTWRELIAVLAALVAVWALASAAPTVDALGRRSLRWRATIPAVFVLTLVAAVHWIAALTIPRFLPAYGAWTRNGADGHPEQMLYDPFQIPVFASLSMGTINTVIFIGYALLLVSLFGRTAGVGAAGALYLAALFTAADQVGWGIHLRMPYWLYPQPFDPTPYLTYAGIVTALGLTAWWASRGGAAKIRWRRRP